MATTLQLDDPKDLEHTSDSFVETKDRYPNDRRLRAAGFRIAYRRNGEEPVWDRKGVLFSEREALLRL